MVFPVPSPVLFTAVPLGRYVVPLGVVVLPFPPFTDVPLAVVFAVVLSVVVPPATPVVDEAAWVGAAVGLSAVALADEVAPAAVVIGVAVPLADIGTGPLAPLPGRGVGCTGSGDCWTAVDWAGPFNATMRLKSVAAERKVVFIGRIFIFFGKMRLGYQSVRSLAVLRTIPVLPTHLSTFLEASTVPMSFSDNLPIFSAFWALM